MAISEEKNAAVIASPTDQKGGNRSGILMKVPEILDIEIVAKAPETILKVKLEPLI